MATKKKTYPNIHLGESFVDQRTQAMFGTSDYTKLNKKQKKKLDEYLTSDAGRRDAAAFRQEDQRKFQDSLDSWKAVSAHNRAIDTAAWKEHLNKRYPLTAQITPPITVAGNGSGDGAETVVVSGAGQEGTQDTPIVAKQVTQTTDPEAAQLAAAKELGFNSLDELKAFQKKVGLTDDGVVTDDLKDRQAWYKHMAGLGYSEGADQNGQAWFMHDGKVYYNNGRMQAADGAMSNYDYKTLGTSTTPLITFDYLKSRNVFRNHYNHGEGATVTIDGKQYPILVTKGVQGNQVGLEDDWTYAFDPETGKLRALHESAEGDVMGTVQGSYHWDPKFKDGSSWIDVSSFVGMPGTINEQTFTLHKNFRNPYMKGQNYVTIDGIKYPVMVSTGLLGQNSNIENDHSYAFDVKTGKIRKLRENMLGQVNSTVGGGGASASWADESDWINLPGFKLGGQLRKRYFKQGGTMNRIKYFQQGGAAQQGAQDIQQQVIALVQAAMQGDEKANQTVTQIMEAAKAGDQQAMQLAQLIQEVAKQMQGQATTAKWGAKLGYIRSLKYAQGGKACPACEKGAPIKVEEKACGGKTKKAKKRYFGGWL